MIACQKFCWLAANNEPKGIFSLWRSDALQCTVASCLVERELSAHVFHGAHSLKATSFKNKAKETMVWWKIPLIYSSWDKSQSEQNRCKVACICYSTEDCRKQPWNVIKKKITSFEESCKAQNGCLDFSVKSYWMNRCQDVELSVCLFFYFSFYFLWNGYKTDSQTSAWFFWTHILPLKHLTWV